MSQRLLQDPSVDEFLNHPQLRTVSSFFLGAVFLLSFRYIINSPAIQLFIRRVNVAVRASALHLPSPERLEESDEKIRIRQWIEDNLLGGEETTDPKNLVLALTIFAATASLAMFGSVLPFSAKYDSACTFAVAWGGLSAQSIRLLAFIRLSIDLRQFAARHWEMYVTWGFVIALTAFMLADTALGSGVLHPVPALPGIQLCYRRHFLPTALSLSLLNILFEIYAIIRFVYLLVPPFLQPFHKWQAMYDIRIGQAICLLLLDLLTMVPSAINVSIAAEFVPFSIALILVLIAFNHNQARIVCTLSRVDSIPSTRMLNLGRGDSDSVIVRTAHTSSSHQHRGQNGTGHGAYDDFSRHLRKSMIVDPHPFSLEALAAEKEKQKRSSRPNSIDLTTAFGISTAPSTPSAENGSEAVISHSMRAKPSRAIHQVFPAGSSLPIRPWPAIPVATSPDPISAGREQGVGRPDSETLGNYGAMGGPPWIRPLPPKPQQMVEVGNSNRSSIQSRRFSAPGPSAVTARSSVIYGSDILRGKRVYDPTRDITDVSSRNSTVSFLSPQNTGQKHWSYLPSPLKEEADDLSIVNEATGDQSPVGVNASENEEQPLSSSGRRRKGTFGAKSAKSMINRSKFAEVNRRSSADFSGLRPPELLEAPPSPSSAPVLGPRDLIDISDADTGLSPSLTNLATGKNAFSTSVDTEPLSATRIRFGARPLRPTLPGERFNEDALPRRLLSPPASASKISLDKLK